MTVLVLALAAAAAAPPDPVAFPGAREAKDPTGRFAVVAVPSANGGPPYDLRLEVARTRATRTLRSFRSTAVVFWSPDGNALAVTDRRNDGATAWLFFPEKPGEIDLDAELVKTLGPLPERTENGRVFLEVVRWLDAQHLRVRLRGWGRRDPEGFDEVFDYEIGGRFRRAVF